MEDVPLFPKPPAVTVERTLAIIKPDAIHHADEIIEEIKSRGFTILQVASSKKWEGLTTARVYYSLHRTGYYCLMMQAYL